MSLAAISLWEPWASLMFPAGRKPFKRIETRSWATPYRGDVLICAAKRPPDTVVPGVGLCGPTGAGLWALQMAGDDDKVTVFLRPGMALGIARLVDVLPTFSMNDPMPVDGYPPRLLMVLGDRLVLYVDGEPQESPDVRSDLPFGDYTPGRFAWVFDEFRPLGDPIPRKGAQGLRQLPQDEEARWRGEVAF